MKTAFIFPGQGVQYIGMGQELYNNIPECRELIEIANEILDFNLIDILFNENELINKTEFTQVAIFVVSLCMHKALELKGIKPDIVAGLSLGEYCALVISGVLSYEDAIEIVRERGKLMDNAVPNGLGTMSAIIGVEVSIIDEVCKGICANTDLIVSIANYNCPGQVVITGHRQAVDEAGIILKKLGAKMIIPLNVSGPFHSILLKDAGIELRKIINSYKIYDPRIPYVANVNADIITTKVDIPEHLEKQVYSSVLWQQSIEKMISNDVDLFIEIGPKKTLTSFLRKINRNISVKHVSSYIGLEENCR